MGNTTRGGRGKQVSATVAPELYSALDDYAWENRRNRTDVVRQAVEEYAQRNNIWQPTGAETEPNEQDNEVHHEA